MWGNSPVFHDGKRVFYQRTTQDKIIPRPCSCGECNRMVTPNPGAPLARNKPLYYSDTCRLKHANKRARERTAARKGRKVA